MKRIEDYLASDKITPEDKVDLLHNYEIMYRTIFPVNRYCTHLRLSKKELDNINQKAINCVVWKYDIR